MRRWLRIAWLAGLLLLVLDLPASSVLANFKNNPPPLPGFTHSPFSPDDSPQGSGKVLSGAAIARASPVIAKISTQVSGSQVAVAGPEGIVYVHAQNGDLVWQTNVFDTSSTPGCTAVNGDARLNSSPAVGDLTGDGVPDVVIGYGTIEPSNCDGGVVALNGNTGAVEWRFSLRAWQISQGYPAENLYGVISTPGVADVDGSGQMVVGFAGLDRRVYLLNAAGSVRFYYDALDTSWSSPGFANVDGDGDREMIIATDISANSALNPPTQDGGHVYAFDTAPSQPTHLAYGTSYLWRTYLDQAIYSSPAIADVLSSNPGPEIVVGSSCFFPVGSSSKHGNWIKILRLSDGAVLQTLAAPACLRSSPAVGDITNDGKLKVVATVTGRSDYGGNGTSEVIAWDPQTGGQLWTFVPRDANGTLADNNTNNPDGDDLESPVIADLDGNGSLEVVVTNQWTVHVIEGDNGMPLTCQFSLCTASPALSMWAWWTVRSTPAIGDLDSDGDLEVAVGGSHLFCCGPNNGGQQGLLYVWSELASAGLGSPTTGQTPYATPWPMFRGNAQRTGLLARPALAASPTALVVAQSSGTATTVEATFSVVNTGGGVLDWTSVTTGGITLTPSSGLTNIQTPVTATVSVPDVGNGSYLLGTITLSATSADNSPLQITLTRRVGPLTYLPVILR